MTDISIEELRENFEYFDENGDGKLDLVEFTALMEALGAAETGEDQSFGFRAIDTDGSGDVEFDEFARWFNAR